MSAKRRKKRAKNKAKREALEAEIMAPFAAQYGMTWGEWKEETKKIISDPSFQKAFNNLKFEIEGNK